MIIVIAIAIAIVNVDVILTYIVNIEISRIYYDRIVIYICIVIILLIKNMILF